MKKFTLGIICLSYLVSGLLSSCASKEPSILLTCNENNAATEGLLVDRIETVRDTLPKAITRYFYNKENLLDSASVLGNYNNKRLIAYQYDSKQRLLLMVTFSIVKNIREKQYLDSFFYDNKNRISQIRGYSNYLGVDSFSYASNLSYDGSDNLILVEHNSKYSNSKTKYFWQNGNLEKTQSFWDNDILATECVYKYDEQKNYLSKLPFEKLESPVSKNNVISFELTFISPIIDLGRADPLLEMCYNSQGFVTKTKSKSIERTIFYKNP